MINLASPDTHETRGDLIERLCRIDDEERRPRGRAVMRNLLNEILGPAPDDAPYEIADRLILLAHLQHMIEQLRCQMLEEDLLGE